MNEPTARDRFQAEVQKPDPEINLASAALYLAQEEYPHLNCEACLKTLDVMAAELHNRLPESRYPMKVIRAMNQYLFDELGFRGNTRDYYDPRNSFLNEVLARRTGIPITLSLVYLELANRVGFPMAGVGMPGHFLLRPTVDEMAVFVDAFHGGDILFEEDCRDRLKQLYGEAAELQSTHLNTIGPRPFLVRMLTNLKGIYLHRQDTTRTLAAIDRILIVMPDATVERRDRGLIHYRMGQLEAARDDLTAYLSAHPDAYDAFEIEQVLSQIRRVQ